MLQLGDDIIDLGSYLKKLREEKNITLEAISARTRINLRFLTAIENNDFKVLPPAYMRAMVKSFAREVDADPDRVNTDLDNYFSAMGQTVEEKIPTVDYQADKKKEFWFKKYLMWIPTIVTGFLILVGIKLCGESSQDIPKAVTEIPIEKVIDEMKGKQLQNLAPKPESTQPEISNLPDLRLQLEALDRVWVRVVTDSKDTAEYIFNAGTKKTFRGKIKFLVLCGNAAGLKLRLNENDLGKIGESGMVYSVTVNKGGIVEKRKINPNKPKR